MLWEGSPRTQTTWTASTGDSTRRLPCRRSPVGAPMWALTDRILSCPTPGWCFHSRPWRGCEKGNSSPSSSASSSSPINGFLGGTFTFSQTEEAMGPAATPLTQFKLGGTTICQSTWRVIHFSSFFMTLEVVLAQYVKSEKHSNVVKRKCSVPETLSAKGRHRQHFCN